MAIAIIGVIKAINAAKLATIVRQTSFVLINFKRIKGSVRFIGFGLVD